jgi:DNA-binding beta-propeller fold protein YncE
MMRVIRRIAALSCIALGIVLALDACAPTEHVAEQVTTSLVWPPAPSTPRIAYIKTFSRPEDLGINKGFFQRLAGLLFGETDSRLIRPMAVVALGGVVYVADPGARGVHRFDQRGGGYELIRAAGDAPLPSPVGLALGAQGDVYVTDSVLAQVLVIPPGAKVASPVPLQESPRQPTGIAFDAASGRLFVVDTAAHRVNVFNRAGARESSFGHRGSGDGEFNYPTHIWRSPAGLLYVTDSLNFRVQVMDDQGGFLSKFGRHGDALGDLAREKGVATDQFGHVYVVDALLSAVQIFDAEGRFLLAVGGQGRDRGEFWLPTGIFIGEDDMVYIADSFNQRVQVFRYIGGAA